MKPIARHSLRTRIFLALTALILAVLSAALGATQFVLSRDAEHAVNRNLRTTGQVFQQLMLERATRLRTNAELLASDFALKRVIATYYDPANFEQATLASVALNYQHRIGVELLWIVADDGATLAASPTDVPIGRIAADFPPVKEAIRSGESSQATVDVEGQLYQVVVVPVLAPDVIGFLVLGHTVDDAFALRLKANTGSDISFLTSTQVLASTLSIVERDRLVPPGPDREALLHPDASQATHLLKAGGHRYLTRVIALPAKLSQPLYALVMGSYDAALAPLRSLQWRIAVIGAGALAIALLAGSLLAGGITSPIRSLVNGMHAVLGGNLKYRSTIERDDEIGYLAASFNEMVGGLEERERLRDTFGRFVSNDVAEAVLGGHVPLAGEAREVTVLFQDIRGFTAISQSLDPATLLRLVNQFFTQAVAAVEVEGGVVKQFTGDGILALFGAPKSYPDHPERAVRAALGIVARLEGLNVALNGQNLPALTIGVGVHTGGVVAGLIGPDMRVEYGVVGEVVNLASRIESLTKDLQSDVVVSREVAARLGPRFRLGRRAAFAVKGSAQPVEVVTILGYESEPGSES